MQQVVLFNPGGIYWGLCRSQSCTWLSRQKTKAAKSPSSGLGTLRVSNRALASFGFFFPCFRFQLRWRHDISLCHSHSIQQSGKTKSELLRNTTLSRQQLSSVGRNYMEYKACKEQVLHKRFCSSNTLIIKAQNVRIRRDMGDQCCDSVS